MVATQAAPVPHRTASPMTVAQVDVRLTVLVHNMHALLTERGAGMHEADRLLDIRLAIIRHPLLEEET